jgi:hypothetical protein
LLTTPLVAFTTSSCFYSIVCCLFFLVSYFYIFTKKAYALLCYAYVACYYNLYLELFALVAANKEKKEEKKEKEE